MKEELQLSDLQPTIKTSKTASSQKERLREVLDRYGHNQNDLAELLGKSYQSVSIKMNGKNDFTQTEIFKIIHHYGLTPDEVFYIFFSIDSRYTD